MTELSKPTKSLLRPGITPLPNYVQNTFLKQKHKNGAFENGIISIIPIQKIAVLRQWIWKTVWIKAISAGSGRGAADRKSAGSGSARSADVRDEVRA